MRRLTFARLLLVAFLPAALAAQANPDSVKLRNDCRLYRQILLTGHPAPHRAEALERIGLCPDASATFGDWLASLSTASAPSEFTEFRSATAGVRDGLIFARALSMAQDHGATATARAVALMIVLDQQGYGWSADFDNVTGRGKYCGLGVVTEVETRPLTPLPGDYMDQSIAVSQRLALDSTEPAIVRNAAACVHRYLVLRNTVYHDAPPPLNP